MIGKSKNPTEWGLAQDSLPIHDMRAGPLTTWEHVRRFIAYGGGSAFGARQASLRQPAIQRPANQFRDPRNIIDEYDPYQFRNEEADRLMEDNRQQLERFNEPLQDEELEKLLASMQLQNRPV
jgi:hypothetical protein